MGRAYTFVCTRCQLLLDDGVDYTACPKCDAPVTWIDRAGCRGTPDEGPRPVSTGSLDLRTAQRHVLGLLLLVQAALAVLAPHDFAYLKLWLVIAQIAALLVVILTLVLAPDLRALAKDRRTRILHGLEHATINILLARGFA